MLHDRFIMGLSIIIICNSILTIVLWLLRTSQQCTNDLLGENQLEEQIDVTNYEKWFLMSLLFLTGEIIMMSALVISYFTAFSI